MSDAAIAFHSRTHEFCYQALHHHLFDQFFGAVIVVNLTLVILETDAAAQNNEQPMWSGAMSWIVLATFCFELTSRMYVLGWGFWRDGINVFDFILVTVDLVLNVMSFFVDRLLPVSFLQIVRLSKLARTAKVFRTFPELRVLMSRLVGTFKATFWRAMLLVATLLTWSVIAVQFIHPLNVELAERGEYEGCDRCGHAYATISDAFGTFCQQLVIGDGWGASSIPVIKHYPVSIIFYGSFFLSVAMAMLNLILGLVVDVSSRAQSIQEEDIDFVHLSQQRMEIRSHILELRRSMENTYRKLTRQKLNNGYDDNEDFRAMLTDMDISEEDLGLLWAILDCDKSGRKKSPAAFIAESLALEWSMLHLPDILGGSDADPYR